jgi:hypothetical protein
LRQHRHLSDSHNDPLVHHGPYGSAGQGWWRTLTGTVEHIRDLAEARREHLLLTGGSNDVLGGLHLIQEAADTVPKTLRWKLRARIGERKRWYQVPDEEEHD